MLFLFVIVSFSFGFVVGEVVIGHIVLWGDHLILYRVIGN